MAGAADADAKIAGLRSRGADRLDPVRFRFIEALARRAATQSGDARRVVAARLAEAVGDYGKRFDAAQNAAACLLAGAATRHPTAAGELQRRFDIGDFGGLRRFAATLDGAGQRTPLTALAALAGIAAGAAQHSPANPEHRAPPVAVPGELKALNHFRDTWVRLSVDRQLTEALAQGPENAGPLNAHRLVLRALERMRELSPGYLNRFMAYADALLWLDETDLAGTPERQNANANSGERKRRGGGRNRPVATTSG